MIVDTGQTGVGNMRHCMYRIVLGLLFCSFLSSMTSALAGQLEEGLSAHDRGDYATALQNLRPLAQAGSADALLTLGEMYTKGQGVIYNYTTALDLFSKAYSAGSYDALAEIGNMYRSGLGVDQDYAKAVTMFQEAAQHGSLRGESYLGEAYATGQGVPVDYQRARTLFEDAANRGLVVALVHIGNLYLAGRGVPRDIPTAAKYYMAAADRNSPQAMNNLGLLWQKGQGLAQDRAGALKLFEKAALLGENSGAYNAGWAYENGIGTTQDLVQAYKWYEIGANEGGTFSARRRDLLSTQLTADQIQQAKQEESSSGLGGTVTPDQQQTGEAQTPVEAKAQAGRSYEVALKEEGGTFVVPVQINGAITLDFTVDSGAADVQIPVDVFSTLVRAKTIVATDYIGEQTYTLADGSTQKEPRFIVRELKVGGHVLRDVAASVSAVESNLLLGESFLSRFAEWTLDNEHHVLKLVEKSAEPVAN